MEAHHAAIGRKKLEEIRHKKAADRKGSTVIEPRNSNPHGLQNFSSGMEESVSSVTNSSIEREYQALSAYAKQLESKVAEQQEQINSVASKLETLETERNSFEKQLRNMEGNDLPSLRKALQDTSMEKDAAITAREDLSAQLRAVKRRLREVEEEQYKAEEDAAALRAELNFLQRQQEQQSNTITSDSVSPEHLKAMEQEMAKIKVELQEAIRSRQQEQQKLAAEKDRFSVLLVEKQQLEEQLVLATKKISGMHGDIQVSHIASSSKKVLWTREMERKFLDLLHEQVQLGRKGEGGFRKEAWMAIERSFNGELNLNLSKDNFKNKLKTWKQGYRIIKELKNTSGFEWNETTQCMDADERVWDELLKRKEFRNAKVYKRQPFQYYNDLAFIVGNAIAEGTTAATAQETEEGLPMDEALDLDDDEDIATPIETAADFDDDLFQSNQSNASGRQIHLTSSSRRPKRKEASMTSSMDVMCETINKLHEGLTKRQIIEVGQFHLDNVLDNVYDALKAIPKLSRGTMLVAYDTFLVEPARAKGFLRMTEEERVEYIQMKFGGL